MSDRERRPRTPACTPALGAWLAVAALALGGLALAGCGADDAATAEAPAAEAEEAAGGAPADDVDYEPAYPEEVSGEGLTTEDVSQQEGHGHGAGEHARDEGEEGHDHDEDGHDH